MVNIHRLSVLAIVAIVAFATVVPALGENVSVAGAPATVPPESGSITTYTAGTGFVNFFYFVCDTTQGNTSCGSGAIGNFSRAGALLEGNVTTQGNTVTRPIFIVDVEKGADKKQVTLYVYTRTDTVSSGSILTAVELRATVPLPLIGGAKTMCSIAASGDYLYIGTDQSRVALQMHKSDLTYSVILASEPPPKFNSITVDQNGYVAVTFGLPGDAESAFVVYKPNGQLYEEGGGPNFMLNSTRGLSTTDLPTI